jgi:phytoene dehydrogenase-like protein
VTSRKYDAVVVGSGPNGLAAAITIAGAGRSVLVLEGESSWGGGTRTAEMTLPGFHHDVCSSAHPMLAASPFFQGLSLVDLGIDLVQPELPLAQPLEDGTAVFLDRSIEATAEALGRDAAAYGRFMRPLVRGADRLIPELLAPAHVFTHPVLMARFGPQALLPAATLARARFRGERARALFAGLAAHSIQSLTSPATAAFGMVMGILGHACGWPLARGGSRVIGNGLVAELRRLGGEVETGKRVVSLGDVPDSRAVLFDLTPRQVVDIAGDHLSEPYRRRLSRYRYGPGVFKLDIALDGAIPWRAEECRRAGTVHLGSSLAEIVASEAAITHGSVTDTPYTIVIQPTVCDPQRAPAGKHIAWLYCHVPPGYDVNLTETLLARVEHFAPGFRDLILKVNAMDPATLEAHNANYIGGDINGGVQDLRQLFTRPTVSITPYATSNPRLYICSSSTPPGGGVHGMCGVFAAKAALRRALA